MATQGFMLRSTCIFRIVYSQTEVCCSVRCLQVELSDSTSHTITDAYAGKEYIIQVRAARGHDRTPLSSSLTQRVRDRWLRRTRRSERGATGASPSTPRPGSKTRCPSPPPPRWTSPPVGLCLTRSFKDKHVWRSIRSEQVLQNVANRERSSQIKGWVGRTLVPAGAARRIHAHQPGPGT